MASITIFLNDVPREDGGEFIFSKPEDGNGDPVYIVPTKGLAIVHHNTDEQYNFDKSTLHQEAVLKGGYKYVARKYVYLNPQPNHVRIVLPLVAMPFGGKLPRAFIALHNALIERFGLESAEVYFQKIVTVIPLLLLLGMASAVSNFVSNKLNSYSGGDEKKGKDAEAADGKSKKSKAKSKKSD